MKKLLVKDGKEKIIEDFMDLLDDDKDSITVNLDYDSKYVKDNILYMDKLVNEEDFFDEFERLGLNILEIDGEKYFERNENLYYVASSYMFCQMPKLESDKTPEFLLMPVFCFPLFIESYDDLHNIIPEIVDLLIENDLAYIGNKNACFF